MTLIADPLSKKKFRSRAAVRIAGSARQENERTLNVRPVLPAEFFLHKQRPRRGEINKRPNLAPGAETSRASDEARVKWSGLQDRVHELESQRLQEASIGLMGRSIVAAALFALGFLASAIGEYHLVHPAVALAGFGISMCFLGIGWFNGGVREFTRLRDQDAE